MNWIRLRSGLLAADRFNPGTHDGVPVAVGESVKVNMQACVEQLKNDEGKKAYFLKLKSKPAQTLASLPQPPEEVAFASREPQRESSRER